MMISAMYMYMYVCLFLDLNMYMYMHVLVERSVYSIECRGFESHPRQLIFSI